MNSIEGKKYHVGLLATHPIQYYAPWYRALTAHPQLDLQVFYAHRQSAQAQGEAGFGVAFDWDIPLLEGYRHQFLNNRARRPDVSSFLGLDTPEIRPIIDKGSFDAFIVQGWNTKSFWQAMRAAWRTKTPLLVRGDSQLLTQRSLGKRLLKEALYRRFVPKFDGYLIVGRRTRDYLLYYGADARKMFNVPHAVDNDFFSTHAARWGAERAALRAGWGIPEHAVVFLFAGKLLERKRPLDFCQAIARARRSSPNLWGLVVGDGPVRLSMERWTSDQNLPIRFAGFLNQGEITKAYVAADALVLPSDGSETWGLVVNEAMACGIPAVVSDAVGCVPDLIQPGLTGQRFDCGDVNGLASILAQWTGDPQKMRDMGQQARELLKTHSIQTAVDGTFQAVQFAAKRAEKP